VYQFSSRNVFTQPARIPTFAENYQQKAQTLYSPNSTRRKRDQTMSKIRNITVARPRIQNLRLRQTPNRKIVRKIALFENTNLF
jgi:hypothetical protein